MNAVASPDDSGQPPTPQPDNRTETSTARYAAFLLGLAVASSFYIFALGLFPLDNVAAILTLTVGFIAWLLVLIFGLLRGSSFEHAPWYVKPWAIAMAVWGALLGVALGVGLGLDLPDPWFWVMAIVVAIPPVAGARLGLRGQRQ